jgi:hypothetical protein
MSLVSVLSSGVKTIRANSLEFFNNSHFRPFQEGFLLTFSIELSLK